MGTKAPEIAAMVMEEIIASAIIRESPRLLLHMKTPNPQVTAIDKPLITPAAASFNVVRQVKRGASYRV
jgi:hypothetical protein